MCYGSGSASYFAKNMGVVMIPSLMKILQGKHSSIWYGLVLFLRKIHSKKVADTNIFLFHSIMDYIFKTDRGRKFEFHCLFEISKIQTTMKKLQKYNYPNFGAKIGTKNSFLALYKTTTTYFSDSIHVYCGYSMQIRTLNFWPF